MDAKLETLIADMATRRKGFMKNADVSPPITEDTLLTEFDSLSLLDLAIAIEEAFALDGDGEIPDGVMIGKQGKPVMLTVGELDRYIARRTTP